MTAPGTRGAMTKPQIAILAALIEQACLREIAEADARRLDHALDAARHIAETDGRPL